MGNYLKVGLGKECLVFLPEIKYATSEIAIRLGLKILLFSNFDESEVDLIYSERQKDRSKTPWVRFNINNYSIEPKNKDHKRNEDIFFVNIPNDPSLQ